METLPLDTETIEVVAKELGEVKEKGIVDGPRQYFGSPQTPPTLTHSKTASLEQIKIRDEASW